MWSAHLLSMSVGNLQVLPCLQLDSAPLAARHPLRLSSRLQVAGDLHLQEAQTYEQHTVQCGRALANEGTLSGSPACCRMLGTSTCRKPRQIAQCGRALADEGTSQALQQAANCWGPPPAGSPDT